MKIRCRLTSLLAASMFVYAFVASNPANAEVITWKLSNHPNGGAGDPLYGFRADDLLKDLLGDDGSGKFTFSFEDDGANMMLQYDDADDTIHIFGTAFGGRRNNGTENSYEEDLHGPVAIDFTYRANVTANDPGDGIVFEVTGDSLDNYGTITLLLDGDGWDEEALNENGDPLFNLVDEQGSHTFSFKFTNTEDPKGNDDLINDLTTYSGWGWLNHDGSNSEHFPNYHVYSTDWVMTGQLMPMPEPGSLALIALGLLGVGWSRSRQNSVA